MSDDTAKYFVALYSIYLWRHQPEQALSGLWFWPMEDAVLEAMGAYRN